MQTLFIMCGIPFAGKTVLSKLLAEKINALRIDLDEVKVEKLGLLPDKQVSQKQWDEVYQEMYLRLKSALQSGLSVIQDAGNFSRYERDLVRAIADSFEIPTTTIFVDVPLSVALERSKMNDQTKERFPVSADEIEHAAKEMEPPSEDEHHLLYSGEPVEQWIMVNFFHD